MAAAVPVLGPSIAMLKIALQRQGVIDHATCRMAIDAPGADEVAVIDALIDRARGDAALAS